MGGYLSVGVGGGLLSRGGAVGLENEHKKNLISNSDKKGHRRDNVGS